MFRKSLVIKFSLIVVISGIITLPSHFLHAQIISNLIQQTVNSMNDGSAKNKDADTSNTPAPASTDTTQDTTDTPKKSPDDSIAKNSTASSSEQNTTGTSSPTTETTVHDTPVNTALQKVLNEVTPPAPVHTKQATTTKPKNKTASTSTTTTPVTSVKPSGESTNATSTDAKPAATSTKATTTPAVASTNAGSPDNTAGSATVYYVPLDTLPRTATYGLSILAMLIAATGGYFVLSNQDEPKISWTDRILAGPDPLQEPLLDQ